MKKIIIALMLCIVSIGGFCQLQTKEIKYEYNTVYDIQMMGAWFGEISYSENYGFALFSKSNNRFEDKLIGIHLGETKEEAIQSLYDIQKMRENGLESPLIVKGAYPDTFVELYDIGSTFDTHSIIMTQKYIAGEGNVIVQMYNKTIKKCIEAISNY